MAFAITRLTNEPIVIVTVALPLDRYLDSFRNVNQQLNRLATTTEDPVYIVFDVRGKDVSFSDVLIALDELDGDPASWIKYPHVTPISVGTHPMIQVGAKRIRQQLCIQFHTFTAFEEALAYIRAGYDDANDIERDTHAESR